MIFRRLIRSWWLLALCGVLDVMIAILYWNGHMIDRPLAGHAWHVTIALLGELTVAAGACTIAAGIWSSRKGTSWRLVLNGLACGALGLMFAFSKGPLAFRTIALLIVVMAVSIGLHELAIARTLRRIAAEWLLDTAGVVSLCFALTFLAFVFRWIKLEPAAPAQSLHWLGSYFVLSAICMLLLAIHSAQRGPAIGSGS